jgi:cell division septum initiation protein DivIVA
LVVIIALLVTANLAIAHHGLTGHPGNDTHIAGVGFMTTLRRATVAGIQVAVVTLLIAAEESVAAKRAADLGQEADTVLETAQRRADELTKEARSYAERLISETVQRSRAIARDTEELVGTMLSDTESQLSDVRRQQGYLNDYLQRMRQAATEVDMEITNIQPPKLTDETRPLTKGDGAAEELPEEVAVTIDADTNRA